MPAQDIVVIGASAGGVEALQRLVGPLAGDLPASLFVVLYNPSHHTSHVARILGRAGKLPASHATDSEPLGMGMSMLRQPTTTCCCRMARCVYRADPQRTAIAPLWMRCSVQPPRSSVLGWRVRR